MISSKNDSQNQKQNAENLDPNVAGQMLQNIFDICEIKPNTVPLDVLESYSNYRKERFAFQKIVIILMMALFLAIPVMFVNPSVDLAADPGSSSPYTATVDSLLPLRSVTATVGGQRMPVYETDPHVYSIDPTKSGAMTVTVTAWNGQYTSKQMSVTSADRKTPVVVSDSIKNGRVELYVTDDNEIAYKGIYAEDRNGTRSYPESFDRKKGLVVFEYPSSDLNIYIPDAAGNTLHLILRLPY